MNPISPSGPWTLGVWVWTPICLVLVAALIALGRAFWRARDGRNLDRVEGAVFAIGSWALAATFVIGTAVGMYPYDSEYHQWRAVSGEVQQVSNRMISDGKAMSQRYVVVIGGQPFGIDDTRASLIKAGDTVSLSCKREWQYAAQSGWACRWNGATR